jgi:hypothetical protein
VKIQTWQPQQQRLNPRNRPEPDPPLPVAHPALASHATRSVTDVTRSSPTPRSNPGTDFQTLPTATSSSTAFGSAPGRDARSRNQYRTARSYHELTAIVLRSFRRAQRAAAVVAISMLSAVVAVELTSTTTETGLDHWVGDNAYLLGVMLVTLWFALVTELSISLWRLAKDDPVSFNHRDLSWTIGVGFLVAFFVLIAVWFWYQLATGQPTLT